MNASRTGDDSSAGEPKREFRHPSASDAPDGEAQSRRRPVRRPVAFAFPMIATTDHS
ncbi:hypothetical protein BN903_57 [Halorubrum sp. AJ67]|nr:hypothetical protein BN903_57 [Halorubrum sp. AJ67]